MASPSADIVKKELSPSADIVKKELSPKRVADIVKKELRGSWDTRLSSKHRRDRIYHRLNGFDAVQLQDRR
jgi:hypothetical protein